MTGKSFLETKEMLDRFCSEYVPSVRTVYKWVQNFWSSSSDLNVLDVLLRTQLQKSSGKYLFWKCETTIVSAWDY